MVHVELGHVGIVQVKHLVAVAQVQQQIAEALQIVIWTSPKLLKPIHALVLIV